MILKKRREDTLENALKKYYLLYLSGDVYAHLAIIDLLNKIFTAGDLCDNSNIAKKNPRIFKISGNIQKCGKSYYDSSLKSVYSNGVLAEIKQKKKIKQ